MPSSGNVACGQEKSLDPRSITVARLVITATVFVLLVQVHQFQSGRLAVVQIPIEADLTEKVFATLQVSHRPWALFDVNPIQLTRAPQVVGDQAIVRPGGIRLDPIRVITREIAFDRGA